MKKLPIAICAALCAAPSFADVRVQFLEGAPKDRFIITNEGTCDIGPAKLIIDFAASNAGLIFDVTGAGAGVEVFQPFEVTEGADLLASLPVISDGDQTATLSMNGFGTGQKIAFTIDVDDTKGTRAITVSNDEINDATVSLTAQGKTAVATMGAKAEVVLSTAACAS
ncbi:aggregation factor core [Pseudorhodobacter sp. W20_MBD10_FR17]|uniref:aggregation factor core n=1 Tax=Pseudorhodobacter sp. W20_MBD10_FR17 TaxID=3240266 RepID=UPI003F98C1AA